MNALVVSALVAALGATPTGSGDAGYVASMSRIDRHTRLLMTGSSWRAGCPVGFDELRLVRITHWGFDDEPHRGRLVIHRRWADEIVEVFRRIYAGGFPIRRVRLVDDYGADDLESMRHDNTSAFNCRYVAGTTTWSMHAYGKAVDVNPVENPYVDGSHVSPPNGEPYADRSDVRPGMVYERDVVWRAFHSIGWEWGGMWRSAQDYQHFSSNGR
jgi:D-alanyl-D-alanine carboxypeptidase